MGAVLAQVQEGKERVIAYASRSLHQTERNDANYSSFKLELLALKWAMGEKFKDYLWGAKVTVVTDNNPLVHLETTKLGAVEQRWVAQLPNFDYTIKHCPGKDHTNADALSRLATAPPGSTETYSRSDESLQVRVIQAPDMEKDCFTSWGRDPDRWRTAQRDDPTLRQIGGHLEQGELPAAVQRLSLTQPVKILWNQWRRMALFEGVVCRKVYDSSTLETLKQVLFPKSKIQALLDTCHKQAAHPGTEQMLSLLRRNFYWPQMEQVVQHYTQNCPRCTLHKARANIRAPLVPLTTKAPMQIVAMDFLTLSCPTERYANILVVTDLFTKYAWAIPTPDQTALTTARALWTHVIQPFGCPETFHSDQGPNFESKLVKGLCQVYGCHKTHTTPYHPQGNGACERFIQMLLSLLGTLFAWSDSVLHQHHP